VHVNIVRSNEYVPPPPAYNMFLWASAAVLLCVGVWILVLYIRVHRRKDE
jgi:cytochrome c-type biogenesis protein CcmH/NrfF